MLTNHNKTFWIAGFVALLFSAVGTRVLAQDESWPKAYSALIRKDAPANISKTPLILIHGIHGTEKCEDKDKNVESTDWKKDYWTGFKLMFRSTENSDLREKYELYIFQYCSDLVDVSTIAIELRDLIDERLSGRNHVIVAHSMGGLVAKSYMAETDHKTGVWLSGPKGGDTTIGLITLATPHHGTPGANDLEVLKPYIKSGWGNRVIWAQTYYWAPKIWKLPYFRTGPPSDKANRSDLRWDNYDLELPLGMDDNSWLLGLNKRTVRFRTKIIAYAGFLQENGNLASNAVVGDHEGLEIANNVLFKGLEGKFGYTDGLAPYRSAMLCSTARPIQNNKGIYPFCDSPIRVRRFEPGNGQIVPEDRLPYGTLSIVRGQQRGYDHLDMFNRNDVLAKVMYDLRNSFKENNQPLPLPPAENPRVPTLFLFDVSGSMNENNKIGQATEAGLDALRELGAGGKSAPPVSIMTFSGGCDPSSTRTHLHFTNNIAEAEGIMRGLPSPNGATPLPQAKDVAWSEMQSYLAANPTAKKGQIILLSDGQSTCGAIRPPGVFSVQRSPVSRGDSAIKFMTVGFDVPAGSEAERDLQYLASITGGKYFAAADRRQLIRALEKHVRVFAPRPCNAANQDFVSGVGALTGGDYPSALEAFRRYTAANPNDWCGVYNLAMAYEANDRYKTAADTYRQYLMLVPTSPDRPTVEKQIAQLNQDYVDQYEYYTRLIQSDLDYLNKYYASIYNRRSSDLAQEFAGFVSEKRDFYANLPEILEVKDRWLVNDSKDISLSIDNLARRTRMQTFDRDALSLLTIPISLIEELLPKLRNNRVTRIP